jgi:hypothetical protein
VAKPTRENRLGTNSGLVYGVVVTLILTLCAVADSAGQRPGHKYFSRIAVETGDTVYVETDTLLVDTLVMRNGSILKFLYKTCVIGISHAFIEDGCIFDGKGVDGANGTQHDYNAQSGEDGKDLTVSIRFEELGSLKIATTGGNGGFGVDGQSSLYASENGENGGNGGSGGRGGHVNLYYLSPHFIVAFGPGRKHAVTFDSSGGEGGLGGKGGSVGVSNFVQKTPIGSLIAGNTAGVKGRDGAAGVKGKNGFLRFLKTN